ncbi:hypothetical protein [Haloferax mediterranei]|uniref:hypothetical protein n=1 Tax=Haloferax mediterranei TaxID=2252 RepID=UPI0014613123|nr:hypothetical protein [Haloferax mediterranei]MDX5990264.1 hypothetical protein [Haloferax mediterranei ATCC 33500]
MVAHVVGVRTDEVLTERGVRDERVPVGVFYQNSAREGSSPRSLVASSRLNGSIRIS